MLDDKRQGLLRERARLAAVVDETREAWEREVRPAEFWLPRPLLIVSDGGVPYAQRAGEAEAPHRVVTHETHRCSVEGCPNLAAYEVMLYDFDIEEGAILFTRDETCPYLCLEHAVDNERDTGGARDLHTLRSYPHTNRDRRPGLSIYLDLSPTDAA